MIEHPKRIIASGQRPAVNSRRRRPVRGLRYCREHRPPHIQFGRTRKHEAAAAIQLERIAPTRLWPCRAGGRTARTQPKHAATSSSADLNSPRRRNGHETLIHENNRRKRPPWAARTSRRRTDHLSGGSPPEALQTSSKRIPLKLSASKYPHNSRQRAAHEAQPRRKPKTRPKKA